MNERIEPTLGPSSTPAPAKRAALAVAYDVSKDGTLIWAQVLNLLLSILTLGWYRFWGVTNLRRILWASTRFNGRVFEYTGTGYELFIGFLKVLLLIILPLVLLSTLTRFIITPGSGVQAVIGLLVFFGFGALYVAGRILSLRYRVARTTWRSIRARLDVSVLQWLGVMLSSWAVTILSLGILKPIGDGMRARALVNALDIGGVRPRLTAGFATLVPIWLFCTVTTVIGISAVLALTVMDPAGALTQAMTVQAPTTGEDQWLMLQLLMATLMPILALLVVLGVPLIVIPIFALYQNAYWRHVAENTTVGPLTFRYHGTWLGLLWLRLGNFLLVLFTLTILAPIAARRTVQFFARNVEIVGELTPEILRQIAMDQDSTAGEGLLGDFDIV